MPINWNRHTKSESDLFLNTRNLYNERFKPVFEYKISFGICVHELWIHKSIFIIKKAGLKFSYKSFLVYKLIFNLSFISNVFFSGMLEKFQFEKIIFYNLFIWFLSYSYNF